MARASTPLAWGDGRKLGGFGGEAGLSLFLLERRRRRPSRKDGGRHNFRELVVPGPGLNGLNGTQARSWKQTLGYICARRGMRPGGESAKVTRQQGRGINHAGVSEWRETRSTRQDRARQGKARQGGEDRRVIVKVVKR
jgi:hypothetical protein